jgi:type IV secretion system protein TrbL
MAAAVDTQAANDLMVVFSDTVSAGFTGLTGAVNGVFGLLITLVVALTGIQWAVSANREILAGALAKILLIGGFAYIINDWQGLSETIYDGFLQLGLLAGGGTLSPEDFLNPGKVLEQGWEIVRAIGETPAPVANPLDIAGNLVDAMILAIAMLGIMIAFAVLAIQIIVSLIEFKIVTLGGFVLLPFGIWNKSAFLAERPLGYVAAAGLKVLALAIVVSGAQAIFDRLTPSASPDIYEVLAILIAALILAVLAIFAPSLAAALVTGGPALGAGAAMTGGLAVGGAGILAGAALTRGGSGVAGAAQTLGSQAASASRAAAGAFQGRSPPPPAGPAQGGAPGPSAPPSRPGGGGSGASVKAAVSSPASSWSSAGPQGAPGLPTTIPPGSTPSPGRTDRASALAAFHAANAGRSLLPANENAGAVHPSLQREES